MNLEKFLQEFGLSQSKTKVYLAALQVGSGSAVDISKVALLPRTTTHEILQQLVGLGLVSFLMIGRTRVYTAEKPTKLKTLLQEKERKLDGVLPELLSLYNTSGNRPEVRRYDGIVGIKTVFEDTLTVSDKKIFGILSMRDLYEVLGKEYMDDYVARRIHAGIKLSVIRSEKKEVEDAWSASTKELRDLHYAPEDMIFPMTIYLYDNKVGIIGNTKENFGMIIESKDFYRTMKNLFDVFWQVSRVGKKKD